MWFGKYTDIASLVLLFGFTQPTRYTGIAKYPQVPVAASFGKTVLLWLLSVLYEHTVC